MDYKTIVNQLCAGLGGIENIKNVSHCATRFRVSLVDMDKFDQKAVDAIEGVKGSIKVGSQYQIIFGNIVGEVYDEFVKTFDVEAEGNVDPAAQEGFSLKKALIDIGTYVQGAVGFILVPLTGCGIVKAILTLLSFAGLISTASTTYQLLWAASDCVMYFFPVMLSVGAAKRLGCSEGMALVMGLMMFANTYTTALAEGTAMTLFGIPVPAFSFANQFLPVLMSVAIYAQLEKFFKKVCPPLLVNIISPMASLLIMTPINFLVISRIFVVFNTLIAYPAAAVAQYRILVMPILAMLWPVLTIFGLHGAVYQTVYLIYFTLYGYDPVAITSYLATHMSIGTTALYNGLRSKNVSTKEMGISSSISMFFGCISEPALFGVLLKNKRAFLAETIGAGIGALAAAIFGIKNYIVGNSASILGLAGYIGPESSVFAVLATVAITIGAALVCNFILNRDPDMA